jgi:cytochrome d ubiquinol oxidase subunit I
VISVAAYYLLKQKHRKVAHSMMKIGLITGLICCLLQLISGDSSAKLIAKYQPAKLAAFEGNYITREYSPISLFGWVDAKKEKVYSISIPGGLSLLTYSNPKTAVTGLDRIPRDEWPNVPFVFQMFHLMVLSWFLMFAVIILGIFFWKKKTLDQRKWFLRAMVFSVALPHIGQQCGWISTEVGRQPWLVWKILRTSEGVSASIRSVQVAGSITLFLIIYILLFILFIFLLDRKIKYGPENMAADDPLYRNLLESKGI